MDEHPSPHGWVTPVQRRWPRLREYDYTQAGTYFITVCTTRRMQFFGSIADDAMQLNAAGRIVAGCWCAIPEHFRCVQVDTFTVMPNHIHGLLTLAESDQKRYALSTIIGAFKSAATKRIRALDGFQNARIWQSSYYEHVVRSHEALERIRQYIENNPLRWDLDEENPERMRGHTRTQ